MSESGRKTLPDVPEWWKAFLDVRQLSGGPLISGRPSGLSGSDRETLPNVQEALPDVRKSLKTLPYVRDWFEGFCGCTGVVGRHSWMSGGGLEALPDVWVWSRVTPRCPGVDGSSCWMSGSGREDLPDVREL